MQEQTISREIAISRIRRKLIELCGSGKSACQVATERDILCCGFNRDSDEELRRRYEPYVAGVDHLSRSDLQRLANRWHLTRQHTEGALVACDVQCLYSQVCRGWNEFSNDALADFCLELSGVRPTVTGSITLPNI